MPARDNTTAPMNTDNPQDAHCFPSNKGSGHLCPGNDQAFTELVREHHHGLLVVASAMVGSQDADEVVQNAWIKAYAAINNFEGRSSLRTWLTRIVINEARMLLRKRGPKLSPPDSPDTGEDPLAGRFTGQGWWQRGHGPSTWHADAPEEVLMGEELADCLATILTDMPVRQLAVLELRDVQGLPFDEICNILGFSASNARVLLHRARAWLYQRIEHYQESGECY